MPPKEKPSSRTACRGDSVCSRSASTGSMPSASETPGGTSESPNPGKSTAHTSCPASSSGPMLRTQCVQLPLPPWNKTRGGSPLGCTAAQWCTVVCPPAWGWVSLVALACQCSTSRLCCCPAAMAAMASGLSAQGRVEGVVDACMRRWALLTTVRQRQLQCRSQRHPARRSPRALRGTDRSDDGTLRAHAHC